MADDYKDDEFDEEYEELKRNRKRRRRENDDEPRGRSRRSQPTLKQFSVLADYGKFLATLVYEAPEGWTDQDVEDYIYDLRDSGLKTYTKSPGNNRRNNRRGRDYDRY